MYGRLCSLVLCGLVPAIFGDTSEPDAEEDAHDETKAGFDLARETFVKQGGGVLAANGVYAWAKTRDMANEIQSLNAVKTVRAGPEFKALVKDLRQQGKEARRAVNQINEMTKKAFKRHQSAFKNAGTHERQIVHIPESLNSEQAMAALDKAEKQIEKQTSSIQDGIQTQAAFNCGAGLFALGTSLKEMYDAYEEYEAISQPEEPTRLGQKFDVWKRKVQKFQAWVEKKTQSGEDIDKDQLFKAYVAVQQLMKQVESEVRRFERQHENAKQQRKSAAISFTTNALQTASTLAQWYAMAGASLVVPDLQKLASAFFASATAVNAGTGYLAHRNKHSVQKHLQRALEEQQKIEDILTDLQDDTEFDFDT